MRILLFGGNGQLGWELQRSLTVLGDLIVSCRDDPSHGVDFSRPADLSAVVRQVRPDAIVNAAAYTSVDQAEREPALAQAINAEAPGGLADAAAEHDAWLVHYSTDYVFDGSGTAPWKEDDRTAPLNAYGRSKLEGEERIRASGCKHLILRTSWIHAARGTNFARTILRLAAERDHLDVVDDQVGSPTGADLIADVTAHALRDATRAPELSGTYHAVAADAVSWYGYARFVIDWARARGLPVRVPDDAIRPVDSGTRASSARRPLNSRLDTGRLQRKFGLALPTWQAGVRRTLVEANGL